MTRTEAIARFEELKTQILKTEADAKDKIREIQQPLIDLVGQYKKEQREIFGFADGDPFGLLEWLKLFEKFSQ